MSTMHFDDNQRMLADSARQYIERGYTDAQRAASSQHPQGCDPQRWQEFAELGWLALPLTESHGGLGGSLSDVCVLAHELGRGLVVEPLVAASVLAGGLLQDLAAGHAQTHKLSQLADGSARIAFAPWEPQGRYDATEVQSQAQAASGGWLVDGCKSMAPGIVGASALIVTALTQPGRRGLLMIDSEAPGLQVTPHVLYDSRHAASVQLKAAPATLLIEGADAEINALISRALDRTLIAHCAETIGVMDRAFEITREYVGMRRQFGKTIASNQTLQHRLVDLYVEIEEARALVQAAAASSDLLQAPSARLTAAAAAFVAQVSRHVWEEAIQLHGAIGMTEEYALGAYVRRLALAGSLYGNAHQHLERLASLSLGESA